MHEIVLDFETYYDSEYSLRKMTPVEYILDPRFEMIGCSVTEDNGEPVFYDALNFQRYLRTRDLRECIVISHNALFDMCILAWRYFITPKLMVDTMSIARALWYHRTGRVSLAKIAEHLELPEKGGAIVKVLGMNGAQIRQAGLWDEYAVYANHDGWLCREIWRRAKREFPPQEVIVNDMVIRCAVNPKFLLDRHRLAEHLHKVQTDKAETLTKAMLLGLDGKDQLMSNDKFADLLRKLGVEPPMKVSKTTGKLAYAFAKTDEGMRELEDHKDIRVQTIVAARLGHKTTLEETRTERFMKIAALTWPQHLGQPAHREGNMPIPLRYAGAHTHRLSGDWKLNLQNMPRPKKGEPLSGALRRALIAPEGHKVITVDSSQIEARIVATICGQEDLVQAFDRGEDIYSLFASDVYQRPINKNDDPNERFVGKQAILGLGFGMGAPRFEAQIKSDSHKQGLTVEVDAATALAVVDLYRRKYHMIPNGWKMLTNALPGIASGQTNGGFGPVVFEKEALRLPSGLKIYYDLLRFEDGQWTYNYGREVKRLFGGKVMENIVQALARQAVMEAAVRIRPRFKRFGLDLNLQAHDELVYVVPDEFVPVCMQVVKEEMSVRPAWMPNLPLACEVGSGQTYGDAK